MLIMRYLPAAALASVVLMAAVEAAPVPVSKAVGIFLVQDSGLEYLRADGRKLERLDNVTNGSLSPDGKRLACVEFFGDPLRCRLLLRPRAGAEKSVTAPLLFDEPGRSGCQMIWVADGRLLISENRGTKDGGLECACRVYDPETKKMTDLKLPEGHWVSGWSKDGKRLLTDFRPDGSSARVAWVNVDGTGEPAFLTPEDEVAYGARLSPDGRKVLFQASPKTPGGQSRLYVMDLATRKRVTIDEPGETHGHCWSPDGSQVAFTWQQTPTAGTTERETLLRVCEANGRNLRTITSRKYKPVSPGRGVTIFFQVIDWR
jgi:Tol biopolymer transport system component